MTITNNYLKTNLCENLATIGTEKARQVRQEIALTISPDYTQLVVYSSLFVCAAMILVTAYFLLNTYRQQNKEDFQQIKEDFRRLAEDLKRQLFKL